MDVHEVPYSSEGIVRLRLRVNIKAASEGLHVGGLSPGGKYYQSNPLACFKSIALSILDLAKILWYLEEP